MTGLVLASTSPTRRELLARTGLVFEVESPGVEERLERGVPPQGQAMGLARRKAVAVAARRPGAVVIGADQVMEVDGEAFGKPADEAAARAQLERLSGREHSLWTGLCVVAPGQAPVVECERTRLVVRELTAAELDAYVATGEWRGCAGGYRVEGRGLALFERIEGDWTNVLGLPMPRLLGHLRRLGVPIFGGAQ